MGRQSERSSSATAITTADDLLVLRYRSYACRIRKMLYLGGVLQDRTHPVVQSYVTSLLVIFMCLNQVICVLNFCRDHFNNLLIVFKCLGLATSFITPFLMVFLAKRVLHICRRRCRLAVHGRRNPRNRLDDCSKVLIENLFLESCCFLVKREKLLELHNTLNQIFEQELARDERTKKTMLVSLYASDRSSYALVFMLGFTVGFHILSGIMNVIIQPLIFHSTTVPKSKWPYKFPWSSNSDTFFYLLFLYQSFTCWWIVFTIGAVDSLFGFYAFQISSILRAMSARLMNPRPDEVFSVVLKSCVQTHHRLQKSASLLEDVYGLIILRMILANAVLMCTLIFEASTRGLFSKVTHTVTCRNVVTMTMLIRARSHNNADNNNFYLDICAVWEQFTDTAIDQLCFSVVCIAMKLLQTFIYAWYGSLITSASEHFREGIYFGEWPDSKLDCHVRADIVMMMLQKPMAITALKVSSVNVNMFTSILNTTLSYYFLLQSLEESK
ncbi:odorant receptor 82a-like [Odontomachus brunneus]|uniref:odorant receptor 82a-like n=1 Tax=Odontomachus brunneus TaxID=486640 RepID=UPI0013F1F165|nr:odorant receptor 82a-like [Odontomachus brunneus]